MNDTPLIPLATVRIALAVFLTLATLTVKRSREREDDADMPQPQRRRNDAERGFLRQTSVRRLLALDNGIFKKMFRIDKPAFLLLHHKIASHVNSTWTPRSIHMAEISSGSHVETILLLASTIRWLAGGSPWDIAYAFHISYATLHARKYDVIAAINAALWNNINFPTTEQGTLTCDMPYARHNANRPPQVFKSSPTVLRVSDLAREVSFPTLSQQ